MRVSETDVHGRIILKRILAIYAVRFCPSLLESTI
jgi:hypothetical protein